MEADAPVPAASPRPSSQVLVEFLLSKAETPESIATMTGAHWRTVYRWKQGDEALPPYYRALHEAAVKAGFGVVSE